MIDDTATKVNAPAVKAALSESARFKMHVRLGKVEVLKDGKDTVLCRLPSGIKRQLSANMLKG